MQALLRPTIITLMVRLKAPFMALVLLSFLGLVGFQIYKLSRTSPRAETPRIYFRERQPAHMQVPHEDDGVKSALEALEALRTYFQNPQNDMAGRGPGGADYQKSMATLRKNGPVSLYYLEQVILDSAENTSLRIELLRLVAEHHEEATRVFLAGLLVDEHEDSALRIQSLHELESYPGLETFLQFQQVYDREADFQGRYLLVKAVGSTKCDEAIPFLKDRLRADEPSDVRCHAASALGRFIERPGVFEILKSLAFHDPNRDVRRNAIIEIGPCPGPEAEEVIRTIAERPSEDPIVRKTAQGWLERRKGGGSQ